MTINFEAKLNGDFLGHIWNDTLDLTRANNGGTGGDEGGHALISSNLFITNRLLYHGILMPFN